MNNILIDEEVLLRRYSKTIIITRNNVSQDLKVHKFQAEPLLLYILTDIEYKLVYSHLTIRPLNF